MRSPIARHAAFVFGMSSTPTSLYGVTTPIGRESQCHGKIPATRASSKAHAAYL